MLNILINLLSIIILGIIQVSFLTTWPFPISSLNLILSLVIFLTVIVNYQRGLWWALGGGLLLELYSSSIFGLITLSLVLTVIGINFLFNNFFTNRSLYSLLILGFIGTIGYSLIVSGFKSLFLIFLPRAMSRGGFDINFLGINFWPNFFWQPLLNLIILAIIFFTYYISTGRLKNIFLFHPISYEAK